MRAILLIGLALGLGVALALAAPTASALSCSWTVLRVGLLPEPGATDVAVNARIWLNMPEFNIDFDRVDEFSILGPDGPVEFTRSIIDNSVLHKEPEEYQGLDLWVFTPAVPLSPGLYDVGIPNTDGAYSWQFSVGDDPDDQAPAVPSIADVSYSVSEDYTEVRLTLTSAHEVVIMEREDRASLDPATLSGQAVEAWSGNTIVLGRDFCVGNWDAHPGSHTRIRLGAFDVSGNFSGFGEWLDIDVPEVEGCGCTSGRSPPADALAVVCLAFLGRRTRRS